MWRAFIQFLHDVWAFMPRFCASLFILSFAGLFIALILKMFQWLYKEDDK